MWHLLYYLCYDYAVGVTTLSASMDVREGILLGGPEKICRVAKFFSLIRMEPETSGKSVLCSRMRL